MQDGKVQKEGNIWIYPSGYGALSRAFSFDGARHGPCMIAYQQPVANHLPQ